MMKSTITCNGPLVVQTTNEYLCWPPFVLHNKCKGWLAPNITGSISKFGLQAMPNVSGLVNIARYHHSWMKDVIWCENRVCLVSLLGCRNILGGSVSIKSGRTKIVAPLLCSYLSWWESYDKTIIPCVVNSSLEWRNRKRVPVWFTSQTLQNRTNLISRFRALEGVSLVNCSWPSR